MAFQYLFVTVRRMQRYELPNRRGTRLIAWKHGAHATVDGGQYSLPVELASRLSWLSKPLSDLICPILLRIARFVKTSDSVTADRSAVQASVLNWGSVWMLFFYRVCCFYAVNQGWVQITRRWDLLTANFGSGYPRAATVEKGEQVMALICD